MPLRSKNVKEQLREYLEAEHPPAISGEVWQNLLARLAPVSESYLRELLRATGLPFDQPWAGIRQHTFEELEQSLAEMLAAYDAAMKAGDPDRARILPPAGDCRQRARPIPRPQPQTPR